MWEDRHPGIDVVPQIFYSANFYAERSVGIITNHSRQHNLSSSRPGGGGSGGRGVPLFLYLPIQNVHAPYQLPPSVPSLASFGVVLSAICCCAMGVVRLPGLPGVVSL